MARYGELVAQIRDHNHRYFIESKPTISDAEYDQLKLEQQRLEKQHPELRALDVGPRGAGSGSVGAPPERRQFEVVPHNTPMLSLGNAFSEREVRDFDQRLKRFLALDESMGLRYTAEPKIDGVSLALHYENGTLQRALTRGDGQEGEDVTRNARLIDGILLSLERADQVTSRRLEVRGEIYFPIADFEALQRRQRAEASENSADNPEEENTDNKPEKKNADSKTEKENVDDKPEKGNVDDKPKEKTRKSEKIFVNARNAASGMLRRLDHPPARAGERHALSQLKFCAFELLADVELRSRHAASQALEQLGFHVNRAQLCDGVDALLTYYARLALERGELECEVDGVVYKIDDLAMCERLGSTSHAPRWAIAHKFPEAETVTRLRQVSASGNL